MSKSFVETVTRAHECLMAHDAIEAEFASQGDDEIRQAVLALHALINSAQAFQAHAIADMGRRARAVDDAEASRVGFHGPNSTEEFVADELALLMSTTKVAATYLYDRSMRTTASASVMKAWRAGRIDARKAESIAHTYAVCGQSLPDREVRALIDAAIEYASGRTAPKLREWLRRREISANPEAAEQRRQQAMQDRRVTIRPVEDGMSELWALLPSVNARAIQQILDHVAKSCDASDGRTMEQRRADTLVELLTGEVDPPPTQIQVVVSADVLTGTSDQPGWLPGVGPVTADDVRELAGLDRDGSARAAFRRLMADPRTGALTDIAEQQYRPSTKLDRAIRARDVTCRFPGCRRAALGPGTGTDVDHTVPWPTGPTSSANLAVLCRRHHRLKHTPGWSVVLHADRTMTWTTPTGRRYTSEPWQYTEPAEDSPDPPEPAPPQRE
ncbi:MAG: DUF222 domain-containing protein [Actinomycetes bacterium]